ncbi:hypothetical protein Pint_33942 [Pistacia integerrima]|uniref:Uncharacterized protein n=1 Tax=Pistacia integerrima TaxID=434235 RepID=A0ACC0X4J4_9ROSI|nr:hypothetical protein Pint_33942 [Pistacia integerrima]
MQLINAYKTSPHYMYNFGHIKFINAWDPSHHCMHHIKHNQGNPIQTIKWKNTTYTCRHEFKHLDAMYLHACKILHILETKLNN